ncbi:MAG: TfoX/Sxy family protein [Lawsonibacter sp.]
MASHKDFVNYVMEQLQDAGNLRAKPMFGEYGLYCDEIFFAVVCDDQLFLKVTEQGENTFPQIPKVPPYEGAKDYFLVEDVDNRDLVLSLTRITCQSLGTQTSRKGKKSLIR